MLKDKVAVVTGGARGIGAAIAIELAACGANIALVDVEDPANASKTVDKCNARGSKAKAWQCDITDMEQVKKTVDAIREEYGTIDILVNNAGITKDGLAAMMKPEDFEAVLRVNLTGAFHMIRQITPLMIRKRWGRIVNISSVSGLIGNAGQANYAASKAGLIGLTKTVAKELAPRGITCNAVAPGFIRTEMTKKFEDKPEITQSIPLGHMGEPEDVATAVSFLLKASYITGEVLRIDGGLAI